MAVMKLRSRKSQYTFYTKFTVFVFPHSLHLYPRTRIIFTCLWWKYLHSFTSCFFNGNANCRHSSCWVHSLPTYHLNGGLLSPFLCQISWEVLGIWKQITNSPTAAGFSRGMAAMKTTVDAQSVLVRMPRAARFALLWQPVLTRDPGISESCPLSHSPRIPSRTGHKGTTASEYPSTIFWISF